MLKSINDKHSLLLRLLNKEYKGKHNTRATLTLKLEKYSCNISNIPDLFHKGARPFYTHGVRLTAMLRAELLLLKSCVEKIRSVTQQSFIHSHCRWFQ